MAVADTITMNPGDITGVTVTAPITGGGTSGTVNIGLDTPLAGTYGGTANAFFAVSGPSASLKTFTFPNSSATVLTSASVVTPAQGGTGVANNAASTLTISGNFGTTLTVSGTTGVTLPTSGTLATLAGTETLAGKTLTTPTIAATLTAGTSLVNGNFVYMATADGKMELTDADAQASSAGLLAICTATVAEDATGTFILSGLYTTSGLSAGSTYYLSTTSGAITSTAPSGTADIVRVVGYALSSTLLWFNPDPTYIEIA